MEGANMDKRSALEILEQAKASRAAYLIKNPEFLDELERDRSAPPLITVEVPRQSYSEESKTKPVLKGAAAHAHYMEKTGGDS
jgi:hypothetical protein